MNNFSSRITGPDAMEGIRLALYEIGLPVEMASSKEDHAAISCLFSKLYLDSLFVLEITAATPGMGEPSVLVDPRQLAEDESLGRDQPLFLANARGPSL